MITHISVENYRSIINAKLDLQPLTVLIGSNNSGKTNFVKSLVFLSRLPSRGVMGAINEELGFKEIIPKTIAGKMMGGERIKFSIDYELSRPDFYPDSLPPVAVKYNIELGSSTKMPVRIVEEKIQFFQPLAVAKALKMSEKDLWEDEPEIDNSSVFTWSRRENEKVNYDFFPDYNLYSELYFSWLGLEVLQGDEEEPLRKDALIEFFEMFTGLSRVFAGQKDARRFSWRYASILDPHLRTGFDFANQMTIFSSRLSRIRRYQFSLSQLKKEQKRGSQVSLSSNGDNLPTIVNEVKEKQPKTWQRVLSTLRSISPMVIDVHSEKLKSGMEYLSFEEQNGERKIESWHVSDGTIRALALILAVETHPPNTTLIIEEPEQNLHPWAVKPLIDHFRETIENRNIQVIITTHSEQVLEAVEPNEVIVLSRDVELGSQFKTLEDFAPLHKIKKGEVGEMWVRGLLGGTP